MSEDSILEQIIENKQSQALTDLNLKVILNNLLNNLSERENQVISLRYGLKSPEKKTLEEIGKQFQVTRERIRQIENAALKKVKNHSQFNSIIEPIKQVVQQTLDEYGKAMHHDLLLDKILIIPGNTAVNRFAASFIINQLLTSELSYHPETEETYPIWKLPAISLDDILGILKLLILLIEKYNQPLNLEEVYFNFKKEEPEMAGQIDEKIIHSYFVISKKIEKNPFGEWGLKNWQSITPKRMTDKVFLVLKKSGQPLHFTAIAEKINEIGFDNKKANPATIHNELILDDKYVLVGRGIYALKEWGYEPGVVIDVIQSIIKNEGSLTKDEIIEKVLEKRQVKKSTIALSLMNKKYFTRGHDKKYTLNG
ncbi:hypothetical protein KJ840_03105 [Patescibacteria group bacterium]|nr:hypothetical protein [Patescibacteria group bacterium]